MQKNKMRFYVLLLGLVISAVLLTGIIQVQASPQNQIPTGSIPTITGTPVGALIIVMDSELGYANVRSGPGTVGYDIVGVIVEGSEAPAIGRSPGGDWIQIIYPGVPGGTAWIYKDLVTLRGTLDIVEPPPTPTPAVTATIDPTLAAQFLVEVQPTRLPTFTPPGELEALPTFSAVENSTTPTTGVPVGFIIIGLAAIGLLGSLFSLIIRR